jgi:hypothetical protein
MSDINDFLHNTPKNDSCKDFIQPPGPLFSVRLG